jgi:hypothetical protein
VCVSTGIHTCIYVYIHIWQVGLKCMLMNLRKCCNHAYLFDSAIPETRNREEARRLMIGAAGKLELLEQVCMCVCVCV